MKMNNLDKVVKSLDAMADSLEKEALTKAFEHELLGDAEYVRPEAMEGLFKYYYAKMRRDGLSKEDAIEKAKQMIERSKVKTKSAQKLFKKAQNEVLKIQQLLQKGK